MSDFKKLIKVKTVSAEKNVSLFKVSVLFQKGEDVHETFHLKCPCIRKTNDKGYQCKSIKSHANCPSHAKFRTDLQKAFDDDCIDGVKSLMKRNHFGGTNSPSIPRRRFISPSECVKVQHCPSWRPLRSLLLIQILSSTTMDQCHTK